MYLLYQQYNEMVLIERKKETVCLILSLSYFYFSSIILCHLYFIVPLGGNKLLINNIYFFLSL